MRQQYFIITILLTACFTNTEVSTSQALTPETQKDNIAVMDLEARGGISETEILSISDRLRGELINTDKYVVIERSQMDYILKEQGFQQSGACSEASCIVEVGQLLAVHKMLGGSIGKVGQVFSINIKIIDVATGKIERQISDDIKCTKEDLLSVHMKNFAKRVAGLKVAKTPLYKKWYFWAPVAVVTGGAAYLLTAKKEDGEAEQPEKTGGITVDWSE